MSWFVNKNNRLKKVFIRINAKNDKKNNCNFMIIFANLIKTICCVWCPLKKKRNFQKNFNLKQNAF